jgi:hypothetical protein
MSIQFMDAAEFEGRQESRSLGVAGLVFAGVTDTCFLGMLLARMPWNTRAKGCAV